MGGVGECGKAKISLSEPRSGGTFLNSTANGKKSRGGGEGGALNMESVVRLW